MKIKILYFIFIFNLFFILSCTKDIDKEPVEPETLVPVSFEVDIPTTISQINYDTLLNKR